VIGPCNYVEKTYVQSKWTISTRPRSEQGRRGQEIYLTCNEVKKEALYEEQEEAVK
jgi:hypothetical protein